MLRFLPFLFFALMIHAVVFEEVLFDRYGLTMDDYYSLSDMKQSIMADSIACSTQNLCPISLDSIVGDEYECIDGFVNISTNDIAYPCDHINLLSFISFPDLGSHINASGADVWGWTQYDINNNNKSIAHYALSCQSDGASIIDITDPTTPNVLAFIPTSLDPMTHVIWRDIKTYGDYAFISVDRKSTYIQIVNLPNIIEKARLYQNTTTTNQSNNNNNTIYNATNDDISLHTGVLKAHNLFVNEDSGFLYVVGSNECKGGLYILDIKNRSENNNNLTFVGCYDKTYVHDVECVIYHGPHEEYWNHEICFAFTPKTDSMTIIDVTNKSNITQLSSTTYENAAYTHQGWVTSNHEFLLMGDETDEYILDLNQRTFVWNVSDLLNPEVIHIFNSNLSVIDHNQYIIDNGRNGSLFKGFTFQSNYEAGVRILNIDDISNGDLYEIAYFDTYIWSDNGSDTHNNAMFRGAWSTYPWFKDYKNKDASYTNVIVSQNTNTGLFILKVDIGLNDIFNDTMIDTSLVVNVTGYVNNNMTSTTTEDVASSSTVWVSQVSSTYSIPESSTTNDHRQSTSSISTTDEFIFTTNKKYTTRSTKGLSSTTDDDIDSSIISHIFFFFFNINIGAIIIFVLCI